MSFLKKVLAATKGHDLELMMYQNAGSYEAAVRTFFDLTVSSLQAAVKYGITAKVVTIKSEFRLRVMQFAREMQELSADRALRWVQIVELYKKPSLTEKRKEADKIAQEYITTLNREMTTVRKRAADYLQAAKHHGLDKQKTFAKTLNILKHLSDMTGTKFVQMLKSGKLPF